MIQVIGAVGMTVCGVLMMRNAISAQPNFRRFLYYAVGSVVGCVLLMFGG